MSFILQNLGSGPQFSLAMTGPTEQCFFLSAKSVLLQRVLVVTVAPLPPLFPCNGTSKCQEAEVQECFWVSQLRAHGNEKYKPSSSLPLACLFCGDTILWTLLALLKIVHTRVTKICIFWSWLIFMALLLSWIQFRWKRKKIYCSTSHCFGR